MLVILIGTESCFFVSGSSLGLVELAGEALPQLGKIVKRMFFVGVLFRF